MGQSVASMSLAKLVATLAIFLAVFATGEAAITGDRRGRLAARSSVVCAPGQRIVNGQCSQCYVMDNCKSQTSADAELAPGTTDECTYGSNRDKCKVCRPGFANVNGLCTRCYPVDNCAGPDSANTVITNPEGVKQSATCSYTDSMGQATNRDRCINCRPGFANVGGLCTQCYVVDNCLSNTAPYAVITNSQGSTQSKKCSYVNPDGSPTNRDACAFCKPGFKNVNGLCVQCYVNDNCLASGAPFANVTNGGCSVGQSTECSYGGNRDKCNWCRPGFANVNGLCTQCYVNDNCNSSGPDDVEITNAATPTTGAVQAQTCSYQGNRDKCKNCRPGFKNVNGLCVQCYVNDNCMDPKDPANVLTTNPAGTAVQSDTCSYFNPDGTDTNRDQCINCRPGFANVNGLCVKCYPQDNCLAGDANTLITNPTAGTSEHPQKDTCTYFDADNKKTNRDQCINCAPGFANVNGLCVKCYPQDNCIAGVANTLITNPTAGTLDNPQKNTCTYFDADKNPTNRDQCIHCSPGFANVDGLCQKCYPMDNCAGSGAEHTELTNPGNTKTQSSTCSYKTPTGAPTNRDKCKICATGFNSDGTGACVRA